MNFEKSYRIKFLSSYLYNDSYKHCYDKTPKQAFVSFGKALAIGLREGGGGVQLDFKIFAPFKKKSSDHFT